MNDNFDQDHTFEECKVFFLLDGARNPYFLSQTSDFVQFLCYNKPMDKRWKLDSGKMIDVPEKEAGINYGWFGSYGAMFYASKNYNSKYVGLGYDNKYLDLSASPKILKPEMRQFIEPYAMMANGSIKLHQTIHDFNFQWSQVDDLFERFNIQALGSLPTPAEFCGSYSIQESIILAYGEANAIRIFKILDEEMQSKELQELCQFTPSMWKDFIEDSEREYLFLGKLALMTNSFFQKYTRYICTILQRLCDKLGQVTPTINNEAVNSLSILPNFYEVIGDYITAFYMCYLSQTTEMEKEVACIRSVFFSEQEYFALDDDVSTGIGPDFLNKFIEFSDGHVVPVFQLWNEEFSDMIYTTTRSEVCLLQKQGYSFEGSPGYVLSPTFSSQSAPVYRLHHPTIHDHLYTQSVEERDYVSFNLGYVQEGLLGYHFDCPDVVTLDDGEYQRTYNLIFRYWSAQKQCHRYAVTNDECSKQSGYVLEGGCFHITTFAIQSRKKTAALVGDISVVTPTIIHGSLNASHSVFLGLAGGAVALGAFLLGYVGYVIWDKIREGSQPKVNFTFRNRKTGIFVIHDGRKEESFPILTESPMLSAMCGTVDKNRPNHWRITTLRDDVPDVEFKKNNNCQRYDREDLYSEFSAIYAMYAEKCNTSYVGIMHYRSYLNLRENVYEIPKNPKEVKHDLIEERKFKNILEPTDTACKRMGYDNDNISKLISIDKFDIITSTPLYESLGNMSLTLQMIQGHGSGNCKDPLLCMLILAGYYIKSYNSSPLQLDKDNVITIKTNLVGVSSLTISKSWSDYMGLEEYIGGKQYESKYPPYFKDLLLLKNSEFKSCMRFVLYVLDTLFTNNRNYIAAYSEFYSKVYSDKIPNRILAFIGERLVGYYINEVTCQGKVKTGVVPRAHYTETSEFLFDLFPRYKTNNGNHMIPIFKLCNMDNSRKLHTVFITNPTKLEEFISKNNYVAQCCVGYVFDSEEKDTLPLYYDSNTGKLVATGSKESRLGYMVMQDKISINLDAIKTYETTRVLVRQWEKNDTSEIMLIAKDNTVIGATLIDGFEISLATFGRRDLLESV